MLFLCFTTHFQVAPHFRFHLLNKVLAHAHAEKLEMGYQLKLIRNTEKTEEY